MHFSKDGFLRWGSLSWESLTRRVKLNYAFCTVLTLPHLLPMCKDKLRQMTLFWRKCILRHKYLRYLTKSNTTTMAQVELQRPPAASHMVEVSHLSATGWHRGGLQGGPLKAGLFWAYSFIPWSSSVPSDFLLHWFWHTTANLMLPYCLLQWHRFDWPHIATG